MGWSSGRRATVSHQKPVGIGASGEWDHRLWRRSERIRATDRHSAPRTVYASRKKTAQTLIFGKQALREKKKKNNQ